MELYIVFFMIIAVALIVLAIYITKIEHLAVTNRTRIARLEADLTYRRNIKPLGVPPIGSVEYELQKAIKENKSLSFQLAEVSKALQENKLLIYEMDAKLGRANLRLESQKNTILAYQGRNYFGTDIAKGDSEAVLTTWHLADGTMTPFIPEGEELAGFGLKTVKLRKPYSKKSDNIIVPIDTDVSDKEACLNSELNSELTPEQLNTIFKCERCERCFTSDDRAPFNQFSQIDFNCCKDCCND